ncbi:MAG: AI-2E family transporter [Halanaerobiaceae bacterium]
MFNFSRREWKLGLIIVAGAGVVYFIFSMKMVLIPFASGIFLAYLLNPFIRMMKKRNFSRKGAILILLIIIFNIIFISCLLLFPLFVKELVILTDMIPEYAGQAGDFFKDINNKFERIQLPGILRESINQFLQEMEEVTLGFIHGFTEMIINSFHLMVGLLISPIITYYILRDVEHLKKSFLRSIPGKRRRLCLQLMREINKIFSGFLRGQIWLSIIIGILISIGLFFLKIRFNLILGIIAGISNMIPYIGPIIGALPAAFIAFLASPMQMMGVVLLFIFVQQLESIVLAPKIMSDRVGLHPLTVIFALLTGTELLGIWGLIFAIPVAGIGKIIIKLVLEKYKMVDSI